MNKYKAVPRINNTRGCTCEGCAGDFSRDENNGKCLEIGLFIEYSDEYLPPCVGSDGVIYVEVKDV